MGAGGYARFPYDPMGGTSNTGGIVLAEGNCNIDGHTLAHEMGHAFGLEHTFSGVDERGECSSCYEQVRNVNGSSNTSGVPTPNGGPYNDEGDREGDWCSDTHPHDTHAYNCGTSSNTNGACDAGPWNNAPVNNHMSYSFCSTQFTDQQARRMHCMIGTYLSTWTSFGGGTCGTLPPNADFIGTPLFGVAPLTVTFTDASSPASIITGWDWTFDNTNQGIVTNETETGQGPHTVVYTEPGTYEVKLIITSPNGNDTVIKTDYVTVISPPSECDTLDSQWLTPTQTNSVWSFVGPGGVTNNYSPYNQGGYMTGVPSATLLTNTTDPLAMSEMFAVPVTAQPYLGAVEILIGGTVDPDGDCLFDVSVYDDDGTGQPDWLATPTNNGLIATSFLYPAGLIFPDNGFYWITIPFDFPAPADLNLVTGSQFHVVVTIYPGDATDELILMSTDDGEGEGDNSTHVFSTEVNPPGTHSYQTDFMGSGGTAADDQSIDFDLAIIPILGPYLPTPRIEDLTYSSVCDTTYVSITDTIEYTPFNDLASVEYQFSDGQTFSFGPPFTAERTVDTYFTTAGPVDLDIIAISATCGRVDTLSTTLSYPFQSTPDADFTKDLTNPICNTDIVTFTGTPTGLTDYTWDFGDGTIISSGTSNTQTHTYATAGTYYVSLTVAEEAPTPSVIFFEEYFEAGIPGTWANIDGDGDPDNYGLGNWLDVDINTSGDAEVISTSWVTAAPFTADDWLITPAIGPLPANQKLYWNAFATDASYPDGYEVRISTASQLPATTGNFGTTLFSIGAENPAETARNVDLSAYAGQTVYIAFRNNSVNQNLLAIDDIIVGTAGAGCSNTETKLDYVEIIDCTVLPPVADGDSDVTGGCEPLNVTFSDITTAGDPATSWLWNFDDGSYSTSQNPGLHTFSNPGTYDVVFEACNSGGCTQETITITVEEEPVISSITPIDPTTCSGTDGTITIAATVGVGTLEYSIDGGTSYQAGNVFNSQGANTYSVFVRNGSCSVSSSTTLNDPASPTFAVAGNNPSACGGTDGTLVLSGLTPSTTYAISYDDDGTTVGPLALPSNALGNITISGLNAGTYDNVIANLAGCATTDIGTYVLADPASPTFTATGNSPTTCLGTDGSLVISGLANSTIYDVTYDDGGTTVGPTSLGTNPSGVITITGLDAGTYDNVDVDLAGCSTTDAGSYTLSDPAAPTFTVSSSNPTTCSGTEGSLTLSGLSNSTSYDVTYDDNSSNVGATSMPSNGSGVITVTGLDAGTYDNISITINGCIANDAGSYSLSDPTAPSFTTAANNPSSCGGTDGSLVLSGLTASTSYDVTYDDDGSTVGATSMPSNGSGIITISGLNAGAYDNVNVTLNNCNTADPATYSLSDPSAPTFTIAPSDPTTCGGSEGSLTISGLTNSTSYDITYTDGSGTVGPTSMPSNGSGVIVIGSLTADSYSNIIVDLAGCAGSDAGPYVLSDPGTPTFTVAASNPTTCGGTDGSLTISGLNNSTSYDISYDDGIGTNGPTSSPSNGSGEITIGSLGIDTYTNIIVDLAGCSTTDAGSYTLSNPATAPTFTVAAINTTTCGGSEGSLTISGLSNSTSYDVTYTDGAGTVGPTTLPSNGSGVITISGLDADTHTNILVDLIGCSTNDAGPYSIIDPTAPTFTVAGSTNPSACSLSDGFVSITGLNASTSYDLMYDDGGTTVGPASMSSDPLGNLSISGLNAGTYDNISIALNNCSTTDAGSYALSDPSAPTFTVAANNPTTCSGADGSIVISGLTGSTIYNITYTDGSGVAGPTALGSDPSGEITISGLSADSYSNVTVELSSCTTVDNGPFVLSDPATPSFTVATANPSTCGGSDGSITLSGLSISTTYNVTYTDGSGTVGPTSTPSDLSGDIVLGSLTADSYSNIIVEINGCSTTDSGPQVLSDPGGPTFNVTPSNPTTCNGTDGSLLINGLSNTTTYDVTYSGNAGTVGPTSMTSDGFGSINVTGFGADAITNVIIELAGCSTTDAGPFNLTEPTAPATPVAGTNASYCQSDNFSDMTVTGAGGTFNWYDDAGLTNLLGSGATFTPNNTVGTTIYYVTETASGCESNADMVSIIIDETVTTATAGSDATICDTTTLVMDGSEALIGTGLWTVINGTGTFTDDTDHLTIVTGASVGANEYSWTISNGLCSSSDTVIITLEECNDVDLLIPTGITPDGDLVNDTWEIQGIDQYPDCIVEIFNKWGNQIFSSNGYPEEWDGTYNGSPLPVGAYYYVVNLNDGNSEPIKGTITIIK